MSGSFRLSVVSALLWYRWRLCFLSSTDSRWECSKSSASGHSCAEHGPRLRQRRHGGRKLSPRWPGSSHSCHGEPGRSAKSSACCDGHRTEGWAGPGKDLDPPLQRIILTWQNAQHLSKDTALQVDERTALHVEAGHTATTRTTRLISQLVTPLHPIDPVQPRQEALLETAVHAGRPHLQA